jgi:APA family basic amino acid/polyamine antiporter
MSGMIAALLIATVSAMVLSGSRVTQAVATSLPRFGFMGARTVGGVPRNAIVVQVAITVALLLTNSFAQVMAYAGFTLNVMTTLAAIGLFVLRRREPDLARPYRTWAYPVTPAIFVLVSLWTLTFVLTQRPVESLAGLLTLAIGAVVYLLAKDDRKDSVVAPDGGLSGEKVP